MTEEKNEEKPQEAPQDQAKVPSPAPLTPDAGAAAPVDKKEEKKTAPAAAKKEKPSNCAGCNKSIRKKQWYYRNGKFYCSKRCWKAALKKDEKKPTP